MRMLMRVETRRASCVRRNRECFDGIVHCLADAEKNESLLAQSGGPSGVFGTCQDAPRALLANSNLLGKSATDQHFQQLHARGWM